MYLGNSLLRFTLFLGLTATAAPYAMGQATIPQTSMRALVGNSFNGPKSTGVLMLSSTGVGFESSDFVFSVPADDILSVESKGARDGFLTLVLDPHSKFITAYPSLISQRSNSIGEPEHLLVLTLDPSEPVNVDLARAKTFQGFIKTHRAEREQAIVGASESGAGNSAHPSLQKTVHVALREGFGHSDGLLTFFPDRLQYDSSDVAIRVPLNQILGLNAAGARETYLRVEVDEKGSLGKAYQNYISYSPFGFQFVLAPQEAIAPAYKLAEDYTQYFQAVRSGQEQAIVNGGSAESVASASGPPAAAAPAEKREIARYDAGFLERHNPGNGLLNGFKTITGIPGTVIVFDTGLGYVSHGQNPNIKPTRQPYMQNGYLKFFVPQSAILSMRDVSVVRNQNAANMNSYIVEVDLDRNSNFFQQSKGLMAESDKDNHLFFAFKERYMLTQFLENAPHGAGARDSF